MYFRDVFICLDNTLIFPMSHEQPVHQSYSISTYSSVLIPQSWKALFDTKKKIPFFFFTSWPVPDSLKQLQCFMGYVTFLTSSSRFTVLASHSPYFLLYASYFFVHTCHKRGLPVMLSRNDIDNRELLTIKMALEGWWHWLEGAKIHLLLWTKHLEYIRTAKD